LLFVAGGATGAAAYVYDLRTGDPVATYQFAPAGAALVNDVNAALTPGTDPSARNNPARLYSFE
jgi:hypothetical protein